MRYSLVTVTVLSAPGLDAVVALPLAEVTQEIWAAGRPSTDSQRATTTGLVPASTVTMEAEFWGLADGRMDGRIDARAEIGERKRHRVAERRLKDVEIDKMEIRQLREKIMCTIIDKQFESPAWQKQIQNLNLQTSCDPYSPPLSLSRANIDKHLPAPVQTPKPLNLLSLSLHVFNLFPLYPHHSPLINNFPDCSRAFPYTNSQSLHDLCRSPTPPLTLLVPPQFPSMIRVLDQSRAGRTGADSRHDKQPDQYSALGEAGRHDALEGEESGAEALVPGQG